MIESPIDELVARSPPAGHTGVTAPAGNPFRGLAPFDDSDADAALFFGRAREAEIAIANVLAARLTVLHGPSGVGKSSLARAGVAHALRVDARAARAAGRHAGCGIVTFAGWRTPIRSRR